MVGVDRSVASAEALRWAFRESQLHDAVLEVVLAWGYLDQYRGGRDRFAPFRDAHAASHALDAFIAATLPDADRGVVKPMPIDGFAADALLDAATGSDLVAIGPRGAGRFLGLRLGSVTERCLADAPCPVGIVRPGRVRSPGEPERVIVGIDGSDRSHDALRWAVAECARRRAQLTVMTAWVEAAPPSPHLVGGVDLGRFEDAAWRTIDRALDETDGLDLAALVAPPERLAVHGGAAAALLDLAEEADLVVVGSRGLGPVRRLLLGSVATEVARHAPGPVVVVHPSRHPE